MWTGLVKLQRSCWQRSVGTWACGQLMLAWSLKPGSTRWVLPHPETCRCCLQPLPFSELPCCCTLTKRREVTASLDICPFGFCHSAYEASQHIAAYVCQHAAGSISKVQVKIPYVSNKPGLTLPKGRLKACTLCKSYAPHILLCCCQYMLLAPIGRHGPITLCGKGVSCTIR